MRPSAVNRSLPTRQQAASILGFRGAEPVRASTEWPSQTFQVPNWAGKGDHAKLAILRRMAEHGGRDPRLREFTINTVLSGVPARDYRGQAAAILRWVQQNIKYVNESNEQLQTPSYTLRVRFGDCDDQGILIAAMAHSIALPFRYLLAGRDAWGRPVRWMEGMRPTFRAKFYHIYPAIGVKGPFHPMKDQLWLPAEPTIVGAPLGWDVVAASQQGGRARLPELSGLAGAEANSIVIPTASPARMELPLRGALDQIRTSSAAHEVVSGLKEIFGPDLALGIAKGVLTMLATQIIVNQMMKGKR